MTAMTATLAAEDVLIIGAGPAGITSAYYLAQAGIPYKVIDRAEVVGSTWANLYPSLQLNTSRYFSHLPDTPFPRSYGMYATGKQYYAHLAQFVQDHRFNIELGVEVTRVVPEGNLWRVEMNTGTFYYKAVITATGIYGCPVMPDIP
ncbi:MAG: NAD(P)/FAD-dependent oxidoreductase, partial [Anaerolineae bacterium]|nr:NAD(P)/FAD-dependent oxidoreductase [Anaerolineae bacterium]